MESKNQKIGLVVILSTVLFLAIILIGMTYAFFTANNPEGSTAEIKSETGRMLITYNDGTDNILPVTDIQPSNKILVNKTFTLTGSNTTVGMSESDGLTMPYQVGLGYNSTFSDGMIHYYIKEVERSANSQVTANYVIKPETGKTEDDYKNQTVPGNDTYTGYVHGTLKKGTDVYTEMVTGEFPADLKDQTIKFNLIIQFPDNNENQDSEKGKTINGRIIINKEFKTMTQSITELYANNDKDENGITIDGLQKDGTGAYNIQTVSSTNEKYNVKLLGNTPNNIIADTEIDAYDNLRYVGANPNNYLSFNDEVWRIIGIFNVFNVETNKYENLVKIIRNDSLGEYSWDTSESTVNRGLGINEWSQADLMYELNCDGSGNTAYCRDDITDGYLSLNPSNDSLKWYNGENNTKTASYDYSKNIKSSSIDKIAKVRWNINVTEYGASALSTYQRERSTALISTPSDNVSRTNIWNGKIGLMYPSDYGYASTDTACRKSMSSKTNNVYNCKNENWLFNSVYKWTLSPHYGFNYSVFVVSSDGNVNSNIAKKNYGVHPVLFLKSDSVIESGTGTSSDPFVLK